MTRKIFITTFALSFALTALACGGPIDDAELEEIDSALTRNDCADLNGTMVADKNCREGYACSFTTYTQKGEKFDHYHCTEGRVLAGGGGGTGSGTPTVTAETQAAAD